MEDWLPNEKVLYTIQASYEQSNGLEKPVYLAWDICRFKNTIWKFPKL